MPNLRLYDYCRSTAAYRVRIALNLKGIAYETCNINLLESAQQDEEYLLQNPQGLVPSLVLADGTVLTQSMAICEYLEQQYPTVSLLSDDPVQAAKIRAFALAIACDIHPLNNLRVLQYLDHRLSADSDLKQQWYSHWIAEGFTALEAILENKPQTTFCFGEQVTLADIFLVAQMFNARRFKCDLKPYPRLLDVTEQCEALAAFQKAHPNNFL
jgi:maleylacetoacetate isomerase